MCDILRAAIKSRISADLLSLRIRYYVIILITYSLFHTCNFFQMLMQINRSNCGHLQKGRFAPCYSTAVFTPQLWDRNGSGTQPGARVHTCSTGSGRSGTSRPPRDVIAVERFRNGSGWLCGVNAQPDAFRSRLASTCVIMKNMK